MPDHWTDMCMLVPQVRAKEHLIKKNWSKKVWVRFSTPKKLPGSIFWHLKECWALCAQNKCQRKGYWTTLELVPET